MDDYLEYFGQLARSPQDAGIDPTGAPLPMPSALAGWDRRASRPAGETPQMRTRVAQMPESPGDVMAAWNDTTPPLMRFWRAMQGKDGYAGLTGLNEQPAPQEQAAATAAIPGPPHRLIPQFGQSAPATERQMSPGGATSARTLAQLASGPAYPAQDLGINLLGGQQSGQYADLRARMGAQQPAPQQPAATAQPQPQSAAQPQRGSAGSGMEGQTANLLANPDFQRWQAPSVTPGFHDNLLRFGLAAMAAGGKPGATTLGALGEAGTSTFDANWKAKQSDIDNTINARKLGIHGQEQISRSYERLDALKQRSIDLRLTLEQRAEAARLHAELQQQIAGMTNQSRMDANETRQETNRIAEDRNQGVAADRGVAAADRATRTAEAAQSNADKYEQSYRATLEKGIGGVTMTEAQKEAAVLSRAAARHPGSTQAQVWTDRKAEIIADAKAAIAKGAKEDAVLQRIQGFGLSKRDLQ